MLLDKKQSLTVQSNNIVGLNKHVERLERDIADLIRYKILVRANKNKY